MTRASQKMWDVSPGTLSYAQQEQKHWSHYNFPNSTELYVPALGVAEEAGELCHSVLKMMQNIRGTEAEHRDDIQDAIGDVSIYLMDICNKLGIDFEQTILATWKLVRERDWQSYPKNGRTE